jgi:hypothetical protein
MRSWLLAASAALSLFLMSAPTGEAVPAAGRTAVEPASVTGSLAQEVRYVRRCRAVQVWKKTRHGRRLVTVRQCHRVWVR